MVVDRIACSTQTFHSLGYSSPHGIHVTFLSYGIIVTSVKRARTYATEHVARRLATSSLLGSSAKHTRHWDPTTVSPPDFSLSCSSHIAYSNRSEGRLKGGMTAYLLDSEILVHPLLSDSPEPLDGYSSVHANVHGHVRIQGRARAHSPGMLL